MSEQLDIAPRDSVVGPRRSEAEIALHKGERRLGCAMKSAGLPWPTRPAHFAALEMILAAVCDTSARVARG